MISYDPIYLEDVAINIGTMFEYAVSIGYNYKTFWEIFISSNVSKEIEKGNIKYLVGYSAIDLLNLVINKDNFIIPNSFNSPSVYYFAGYSLTKYQNLKGLSFYKINKLFPIEEVIVLYDTLHEADITKFYNIADSYILNNKKETNLKNLRKNAGLSQKELAYKSNVSLRNIQMYEQRHNDINKAQADILFKLSKTLCCNIEDLLETKI